MKRNHKTAFLSNNGHNSDSRFPPRLLPTVEVEGIHFPAYFEKGRPMREHIECIRTLPLRPDDVLICAYPKSGTHWLWEVCFMLLSGKAEYNPRTKEHLMLEITDVEKLQLEPSPRILNTHLPVAMLPREVKDKRVKVVHVYRNVKDVFVSMYHHIKQTPGAEDVTLDVLERLFHSSQCPCGNYFNYLREMNAFIKNSPDVPIFNVAYEDIKENPVEVVTQLGEFLGVSRSIQLSHQVSQACDFHNLKAANSSKQQTDGNHVQMYRKGEVGDWKNYLTVKQSETFDGFMRQLVGTSFRFRFTL